MHHLFSSVDLWQEGVRIVDEEQFGPVIPLIKYTDVEDALERANATDFGLGASVWTNDLERGAEIAGRLQSGVRGVNAHPGGGPGTPSHCRHCRSAAPPLVTLVGVSIVRERGCQHFNSAGTSQAPRSAG